MKTKFINPRETLFSTTIFLKTIIMKNLYKYQKSMFGFLILILFFSCEANVEEETFVEDDSSCDPDISFAVNIKPIIDNNCLQCHGGIQLPNLSSYAGISANANDIKFEVVSRAMPQVGSLTEEEIQLISCWVDNGALNN